MVSRRVSQRSPGEHPVPSSTGAVTYCHRTSTR
jgi:hypothetical protein